ncbi:MAG: MraY family glycosyltransferase [Crocinitomicaceae bacterium]|nr:MraY family glycosyltransferase [Crocinitomicaceae bacterium]
MTLLAIKILQLVGFALGGIILAIVCNVLLLNFSKSLGIRNKNDVIVRWSRESKPSLGGVSLFIVFIFAAIAYSIVFGETNIFQNHKYVGLFLAGSLAFAMGLADDAYNTKPLLKLGVQILCGVIFVMSGTYVMLFDNIYIDGGLTVLWVIIIMNSLNMLDNMDGITGTTSLFILIACLLSSWIILGFNMNIWSLSLVSLIGALIGFLSMNIHPSKLFMGDAGSQFIGAFVAFFGMEFLINSGTHLEQHSWLGLCVTIIAFTPAAVDTLTVVINRLKRGQSPMVGGKDHTTHHLVYAGLNDIQVWYVFVGIGAGGSALAILMVYLINMSVVLPILFFVAYFVVVFIILYRNTIKYPQPKGK